LIIRARFFARQKNRAFRGCAIAPALRARFAPPPIPRAGRTLLSLIYYLLSHVTQGEKFTTDDTDEHGQKSGIPIKKSVFFRIFREVSGLSILLRKVSL
jgi:hypothetical protein